MKTIKYLLITSLCLLPSVTSGRCSPDEPSIRHDAIMKTIRINDRSQTLSLLVDYSQGCKITALHIKDKNTLSESGVYTGFRTKGGTFRSDRSPIEIKAEESDNKIVISNISYGDDAMSVSEAWIFELAGNGIAWSIRREYNNAAKLEEMAFPQWNFADLSVWKGGIIDNGGMVWCKYLENTNDTYGIHTGGVTFWNPASGNALRITTQQDEDRQIASKFSHSEQGEFTFTQFMTGTELEPRYNLSRFVHGKPDVFAPFDIQKETVTIRLELEYIDYTAGYSRGKLPGIDAEAVRELMNTTGRYGVVDNGIVGANGWTTNWKCLHEPFFAQIGMALNDDNYTRNMSSTLDRERDYAITGDGRVLSRWHDVDNDQIPGTFNYKTGYYEAVWGYTMDSQTGYVINTAEQFDLCGDINWLNAHKASCEKALDRVIGRDSNHNGIFEMMNNNIREQKASDWLDIVWAGFENAFVNAQMYEALKLWADCEATLGDTEKSAYYAAVASGLKENFNKSVHEGGFWYPEKKQYIYWRDDDGSIHGDNLVTPVNFAVIAFGLCDDRERTKIILDEIERRTAAENLFHWPLCFDSYKREEVHINNWPFPKYENGDIFPTWGYLGIRAYAGYDKKLALKYICNLLNQYNKDGLSSQRYSRETQEGLGNDILAGICTTVTALYRDIYGIRPKWNRMGIEPDMLKTLNGTAFTYTLRNVDYKLRLNVNDYEMQTDHFTVKSKEAFGATFSDNEFTFYPRNKEEVIIKLTGNREVPVKMVLNNYSENDISWSITSADRYGFTVEGLDPVKAYRLTVNGRPVNMERGKDGKISFSYHCIKPATFRLTSFIN
ncbi:MAG: hypothetical protein LBL57_03895 [Tannerella sp.]|nr:hypothetical protein [Tannerella sp.]